MAKITFINPANSYREIYDTSASPVWCLLFGCFYWLVRGNIAHALLSLAAAMCSFGISWLIYPLFANRINIRAYQRRGWIIGDAKPAPIKEMQRVSLEFTPRGDIASSWRKGVAFRKKHWKWMLIVTIIFCFFEMRWMNHHIQPMQSYSSQHNSQ